MNVIESEVATKAAQCKQASYVAATLSAETRKKVLLAIATILEDQRDAIKNANLKDVKAGESQNLSPELIDRLLLNDSRITEMIEGLKMISSIPDRIGVIEYLNKMPNGLLVGQMYAPLGVVGIIYESRPNVTIDAAGICIKAGNVILLRGGSEAINSNMCLVELMAKAAYAAGFPQNGIQIVTNPDRKLVDEMVTLRPYIDVLIPRGSQTFIDHIVNIAKVPIIETGAGNCHIYIDREADIEMGVELVFNGKVSRPSVCNATKKVLVHQEIAAKFLPKMKTRLESAGVIFLTDKRAQKYIPQSKLALESEWYEEFLDMRLGVKIVDSIIEAINHINHYGSHHTDAIVSKNYETALTFINTVDSASLIWNASTRFTDGGQFGLGAEIGISTQKLHWRGPMSVYQLMSKKFVTFGTGQIRT